MKALILAGAAALAVIAAPATAEEHTDMQMSTTQQAMYDGWDATNRAAYDGWPHEVQMYYWTLTPAQHTGWWALTDDQRTRVYAMTPEQRTAAWAAIASQMSNVTATTATTAAAAGASTLSGNMRWVSNEMVQPIAADQASTGEVPICGPNQFDNCINAWEAGKRGANVTRPLDHWPGKPASEM